MTVFVLRNIAVLLLVFAITHTECHATYFKESNFQPDIFKHATISQKYQYIKWPYETGWYIIKGALNTKTQVGGPLLFVGSWPEHWGGYTIAYFVPYGQYIKRTEANCTVEQLIDGCTSTYTFRLFRNYVPTGITPGSNFNAHYYEKLMDTGIIELLFVPDIKPGLYCLVFKLVLQDPYTTLDGALVHEYMNVHYLLSKDKMDNIEYEKRFTVQVEGSITDDILNMHSEGSVSNEDELLKFDANNDIGKDETRFTDSGSIRNYLYFLAFAFIVAFLCGYYCRNIRIWVARRK